MFWLPPSSHGLMVAGEMVIVVLFIFTLYV